MERIQHPANRTLKAFYMLEVHGTQKVVKAVNDVDLDDL